MRETRKVEYVFFVRRRKVGYGWRETLKVALQCREDIAVYAAGLIEFPPRAGTLTPARRRSHERRALSWPSLTTATSPGCIGGRAPQSPWYARPTFRASYDAQLERSDAQNVPGAEGYTGTLPPAAANGREGNNGHVYTRVRARK